MKFTAPPPRGSPGFSSVKTMGGGAAIEPLHRVFAKSPSEGLKFASLGDPVTDVLVDCSYDFLTAAGIEEPGGCTAVEQCELERLLDFNEGDIVRIPGGSAANVAKGLANLGLDDEFESHFVGMVGKECPVGVQYRTALEKQNVTPRLLESDDPTPSAQALCMITPDGQRTMRTFLGAASRLAPADLGKRWLEPCFDHVHVEGYTLYRPELARAALREAREAGCRTSIDLASFELVRLRRSEFQDLLDDGLVDLVFCNEEEACALVGGGPGTGPDGCSDELLDKALGHLLESCQVAVITKGEKGCIARGKDGASGASPACHVDEVVDTTGAGDTFCAGFLHAFMRGASLQTCCSSGCAVGAEMVQVVGAEMDPQKWAQCRKLVDDIIESLSMAPETPHQMAG